MMTHQKKRDPILSQRRDATRRGTMAAVRCAFLPATTKGVRCPCANLARARRDATTPRPVVVAPRRGGGDGNDHDGVDDGRRRRRGVGVVARGKKKKGFAELLGGEDEPVVVAKSKSSTELSASERCPCGGGAEGAPYARCCKPFHKNESYPDDCVTLMRSRFSAYAKGEGEYVVKTTHPENPIFRDGAKAESGKVVSSLAEDVRMTCKKVKFYGLEIVTDRAGKNAEEHMVGFKYKCRVVGQKGFKEGAEENHSELSTFRKGAEDGKWLFLDGITGAVEDE
jgi:SEC-C motif domain protein